MNEDNLQNVQLTPPFNDKNENTPTIGGGLPVIEFWAEHTLSPKKGRGQKEEGRREEI